MASRSPVEMEPLFGRTQWQEMDEERAASLVVSSDSTRTGATRQGELFDLAQVPAQVRERRGVGRPRVTGIGNTTNRYRFARAEHWREQARIGNAKRYQRNAEWFRRLKESSGCAVCGETFFAALDFHHLDPSQKSFIVSTAVHRSRTAAFAEMRKCVLLCKNCHYKAEHNAIDLSGIEPFDPTAVEITLS